MTSMIATMHASHAFICVEVHVNGKRVGGNGGTFLRVELGSICKEVLAIFLQMRAPDYYPLPDDVKVITRMCTKISDRYCPRLARLRCRILARLLCVSRLPCVDAHERGPNETVCV
jgi:hypothetical protein